MFGSTSKMSGRVARWLAVAMAVALAAGALTGCGAKKAEPAAKSETKAAFPVTITDDAGRKATIKAKPERIVSLAPANTEIVAALGAIGRLKGVTTYCDYPAEVKSITKVGDFAQPNMEAIAALRPDLVLVTTGVQADVIGRLEQLGCSVVAIDPQSLDAVYESIGKVGKAIGEKAAADELVSSMQTQAADIAEKVDGSPTTCFLEIAQDPLYTVGSGTLLNDLIEQAGGENVVTQKGYVAYSVEQLVAANPEVYLATKGSMSNPSDIMGRPGYDKLTAVRDKHVYLLDDNLVSRPGPRVVEGIRQIAEALHPDAFGK